MEIKVGVYTIYSDKYCMWITKTYKPKGKGAKKEFVEGVFSCYNKTVTVPVSQSIGNSGETKD